MDPNGNGCVISRKMSVSLQMADDSNEDLEFIYDDCDTHANEIAELYSYTEHADLHMNLAAFEEQMANYHTPLLSWAQLSTQERSSIILKILDQLEFSDRERRMKSARCILYIAQGSWVGIQSDLEQIESAKHNCILLYKLGAFSAFVDLLNLEVEMNPVCDKLSICLSDSEDLRVILSVLYTIAEVIRSEKNDHPEIYNTFCTEMLNSSEDDFLITNLFTMLTKFCSGSAPHYPIRKVLLLLWKLILIFLGGTEELKKLKAEKRKKVGLSPEQNTLEVVKTMRPSSPPIFQSDLLGDQIERRKRSLVKQSSLEDNESINMDFENVDNNLKSKENFQHLRWHEFCSVRDYKMNCKLPWKPKVSRKEVNAFLNVAREKFIGYSLEGDCTTLFGLPNPIRDSINILQEHIYISLTDLHVQNEENVNRNPLTTKNEIELSATEILYCAMFPNLPQYMICLLKVLLATTSRAKTTNDSINLLGDVLPKELPMTVFQSMKVGVDVNRHKEIIVKAVSAILLLLLKHFKLNHVYQFEFMSQHLVFANCIPLILKFFNQEVINFVKAGNTIQLLDFPSCILGNFQHEANDDVAIGPETKCCWRNVFSSINLLRILNKLCKWKDSRIMMLVIFKSNPILKRTLKIRQAMAQFYVLKLIKMQAKYLGRTWRKSNLRIVSLIYQKVRHHLNDDWAYGNYCDAKPWDFQNDEIALKNAVDLFNNRRYMKNVTDVDLEPVDNNVSSVLGYNYDLSTTFQKNYYLWLEDEVFNNEIDWDNLF